jgi:hypothetical protein
MIKIIPVCRFSINQDMNFKLQSHSMFEFLIFFTKVVLVRFFRYGPMLTGVILAST